MLSGYRVKKVFFKTLVDEVQELEALSKDPGAVVHGKRYAATHLYIFLLSNNKQTNKTVQSPHRHTFLVLTYFLL